MFLASDNFHLSKSRNDHGPINAIGLERRGFDKDTIAEIREAFKIIYKRNYSLQEAIDQLKAMRENCDALQVLIDSLESSEKGIHR